MDAQGWPPAERREHSLIAFRLWREREVRGLRGQVAELEARLSANGRDKAARATSRDELRQVQRRLSSLLEIPPLAAGDMCSECQTPSSWHRYVTSGGVLPQVGPCPAWPQWAARLAKVRKMITTWANDQRPALPVSPKPEPIAVIPSGCRSLR